jgi:hypothetical protein
LDLSDAGQIDRIGPAAVFALGRVDVDYRLRLEEIAPRLVDLTS